MTSKSELKRLCTLAPHEMARRLALAEKVVEASKKLREHWHGEGHGRYACAGEADFLEALAAYDAETK
jgi:hypothetical protein